MLEEHLPALQKALLSWVKAHPLLQDKTFALLAGDGKVIKGSKRSGEQAYLFVSVFLAELALTIGYHAEEGRHEARLMEELIPVIVELFGADWLLTLDAAYTEHLLTQKINEAGGAYFVPLKNNAKAMKEWAKLAFNFSPYPTTQDCSPHSTVQDVELRSGEVWERTTSVQTTLPEY